ncbi:MAG: tRNA (adenosine(37)-N6)-threonylcarbamoyltransferase complex ATPase subunit type 1 TsaE, partial [Candidatus Komeilibacteria bacterium RIFCSPHIGHO2_01_FULL_52_14]
MREEIITRSAAATKRYAAKLVRKLGTVRVIGLEGGLGAGKTVFVKGIAKGLGVKHLIQSPTFVIMRVYPVKHRSIRTLVHVDCYRLKDSRELMD